MNNNGLYFKNNHLIKANYIDKQIEEVIIGDAIEQYLSVETKRYDFKTNEYKLLNSIFYLAQFNYDNKNTAYEVDGYKVAKINNELYKEINKNTTVGSIAEFEKTIKKFMGVSIALKTKKYKIVTSLIPKYIIEDDGIICCIDKDIYNIIMSYNSDGYSPLDVKMLYNARGVYTQYLYEYMRSWSGTKKEITCRVDDLKEILHCAHLPSYDKFFDFKRAVLNPAIKEINKKFGMQIDFTENKYSRKVVSLTFSVHDTKPRHIDFNANKVIVESKCESVTTSNELNDNSLAIGLVELLRDKAKIKLSITTIKSFINKFGENNTKEAVNILINRANDKDKKKVGAPKKYLQRVLEDMYARENGHAVQKNNHKDINPKSFNNFEPRVYDYEKLEKQLLGWDKPDEINLEDKSNLGNYTSNNSKRFKAQPNVGRSEEEYGEIEKQLLSWYEN